LDNAISIYKVEAQTGCSMNNMSFFITAANLVVREGTVFYYERENLQKGERIANWFKRSS
jgi:hypothetical protein